ncbi:unnamed protein product [Protopolystoma xenopodis]|uniref:Uncharacterized protein n=1 Tax=Protopolystoma xenopodis TaxID=117903 RepID=A0A448WS81_9PLAT|nr:unnamed protein product [Protopolystoma xenopodis]
MMTSFAQSLRVVEIMLELPHKDRDNRHIQHHRPVGCTRSPTNDLSRLALSSAAVPSNSFEAANESDS